MVGWSVRWSVCTCPCYLVFNKDVIAPCFRGQSMAGQLTGQGCVFACVCICVYVCDWANLIIIPSSVHVSQLLKSGAPVIEVVIVLVSCAGGVEGADRASGGAATLVVKHQQGVVWRSCGIVVCCSQSLKKTGKQRSQLLNCCSTLCDLYVEQYSSKPLNSALHQTDI